MMNRVPKWTCSNGRWGKGEGLGSCQRMVCDCWLDSWCVVDMKGRGGGWIEVMMMESARMVRGSRVVVIV